MISLIKSPSFAAAFSKLFSAFFGFAFLWALTNTLTPSDAGVFLYSYTIMMITVQISRAGSDNSIIKSISGVSSYKFVSRSLFYHFVIAVTLCIVLSLSIYIVASFGLFEAFTTSTDLNILVCLLVSAVLFLCCQILGSFFQSRYRVYVQYWCLGLGVSLSGFALCAYYFFVDDYGVERFALLFSLACLAVLLISFCIFIFSFKKSFDQSNEEKALSLVDVSKAMSPFALLAVLNVSIQWGGNLLSGVWLSGDDLAVLSIVIRLSMLAGFLFLSYSALHAPLAAKLYREDSMAQYMPKTQKSFIVSVAFSLCVFLVFSLFGRLILSLFGEAYIGGYLSLVALSFAWLIRTAFGPVGTVLLMANCVSISRKNLIISAVVGILSSLLLIPLLGVEGAVLSTVLSSLCLSLLNYYHAKKIFEIDYFSFLFSQRFFGVVDQFIKKERA